MPGSRSDDLSRWIERAYADLVGHASGQGPGASPAGSRRVPSGDELATAHERLRRAQTSYDEALVTADRLIVICADLTTRLEDVMVERDGWRSRALAREELRGTIAEAPPSPPAPPRQGRWRKGLRKALSGPASREQRPG